MVPFVGYDLCDKGDTTSSPATYFETFMPVSCKLDIGESKY